MSKLIREAKDITQNDCTELLEYLAEDSGTFTHDQRTNFAQVANTRFVALQGGGAASASDEVSQKHLYVHHYYPDWLWSLILSTEEDMHNKILHTADFWVRRLGIRYACEQTKRLGVAILHVASKIQLDPQLGYDHVHALQDAIVAKRVLIPGTPTLKVFMDDPQEFWKQYPDAYAKEHPPVKCRIDEVQLFHRNTSKHIPARDSNKRVTRKRTCPDMSKAAGQGSNDDVKDLMLKYMFGQRSSVPSVPMNRNTVLDQTMPRASTSAASEGEHRAPTADESREGAIVPSAGVPSNVGEGLPGVFKLGRKSCDSEAMKKIRADIAAAVASAKGKKKV